jgi:hypothetical protein
MAVLVSAVDDASDRRGEGALGCAGCHGRNEKSHVENGAVNGDRARTTRHAAQNLAIITAVGWWLPIVQEERHSGAGSCRSSLKILPSVTDGR